MNHLQEVYFQVRHQLPISPVFQRCYKSAIRNSKEYLVFNDTEVCESEDLILSILRGKECLVGYDRKHFHALTILCAAWSNKNELVKEMLTVTPYDVALLTHLAALVFACKKHYITLPSLNIFYMREIPQQNLCELAYAAGAGGNFDLLRDLRNYDAYLMNEALDGAARYGEENVKTLKKMGTPFNEYCRIPQPVETNETDWISRFMLLLWLVVVLLR